MPFGFGKNEQNHSHGMWRKNIYCGQELRIFFHDLIICYLVLGNIT